MRTGECWRSKNSSFGICVLLSKLSESYFIYLFGMCWIFLSQFCLPVYLVIFSYLIALMGFSLLCFQVCAVHWVFVLALEIYRCILEFRSFRLFCLAVCLLLAGFCLHF